MEMRNVIKVIACLALVSCQPAKQYSITDLEQDIISKSDSVEGGFALAFRDVKDSSMSLFINEKEQFHAASTMKVPVMIELFKRASEGEFALEDSLVVKNEFKSIVDQSIYSLDRDEKFMFEDLIRKIILWLKPFIRRKF